ncbi:MAG: RNA 2'-phosphotransferase, partial [Blautia sp.]|nr:RNA 2'-phosphotransferase [Blautia sp.]
PPAVLYHGTSEASLSTILEEGLLPMGRLYVHLSKDVDTARKVGSRHGKPVIFIVKAGQMQREGYGFYLSENEVWLTKTVPTRYLEILS